MTEVSTPAYRFGDVLALARQSWVKQMAAEFAAAGFGDYRRTDAASLRLLGRGPLPIGRLGDALGVTRQAARKIAAALEERGYAGVRRDERDARTLNVALTAHGQNYAQSVVSAINRLNERIARIVSPDELAAADAVLRAVLSDEHSRAMAERVPSPSRPTPAPGQDRTRPAPTGGSPAGGDHDDL